MDVDWARKILGLQGSITPETVTSAFRRACLSRHPDHGGSAQAFIEAKIARDLLMSFSQIKTTFAVETENKWTVKVKKHLVQAGAIVFKVHGHLMQESGWPDLQVYYDGRVWHLELKTGKHGCESMQKHRIKELLRVGIWAGVFALRENGMWIEDCNGNQKVQVPSLSKLLQMLVVCCEDA